MSMTIANWKLVVRFERTSASSTDSDPIVQRARRAQMAEQIERERAEVRDRWMLLGSTGLH